jgi:glyoxylase I family protein
MSAARIFHVALNVTDIARSVAFYELLGFSVISRYESGPQMAAQIARMFGDEPNEHAAVLMRMGTDAAATCLDLVEWHTRPTHGHPYTSSNHVGIYRFSIHVQGPEALLARLRQHNVTPSGDVIRLDLAQGQPSSTLLVLKDPDGIVVEIVSGLDHLVS